MRRTGIVLALVAALLVGATSAWAVSFYPLPAPAEKGAPEAERGPLGGVALMASSWEVASGGGTVTASGALLTGQFAVGKEWVVGGAFNSIKVAGDRVTFTEGNVTYRLPRDWGVQAGLIKYEGGTDYLLCGVKSFRDARKDAWQADVGLGWYGAEMTDGSRDSGATMFLSGAYNIARAVSLNASVWSISLPDDTSMTRSAIGVGYRF